MSAIAPNPVFSLGHETYTVKVENIAPSVSVQNIVDLFGHLIGEVSRYSGILGGGNRRYVELSFNTQDAMKKALCMTGYNVAGVPLAVNASRSEPQRHHRQGRQSDARRNLYVLGLPFDLTKSEFADVFSHYGTVCHAVILATVDNASRRRGFIVMSSHEEARCAMDALSRKEIKGHLIDVSWAVVQRSQGFLDGGDRTIMLANQAPNSSPPGSRLEFDAPPAAAPPPALRIPLLSHQLSASVPTSLVDSSTITVSNLPAGLFSSEADLRPLFCPFGDLVQLKVLNSDSRSSEKGNVSVLVEYQTHVQAREARDFLYGQVYADQPVRVDFVQSATTCSSDDNLYSWQHSTDSKLRLNPDATPFAFNQSSKLGPRNMGPAILPFNFGEASSVHDDPRLVGAHHDGLLAPHAIYSNNFLCPPPSTPASVRPSSAPSGYVAPFAPMEGLAFKNENLWKDDSSYRSPRPIPWSLAHDFSSLSTTSLPSTYVA